MIRKGGSQNKLKKIPEEQEYAPRLEPMARTLALRGFLPFVFILTPFFLWI